MAQSLHWLIALLIFVQFSLAWVMGGLTGIRKFEAFNLHKSIGITLLALMILRAFWRLLHPVPALPASTPKMERIAAHLTHLGLYLVIILVTLTGWAMISAAKYPSVLFQSMPFPLLPWLSDMAPADKEAYLLLFRCAHIFLGTILLVLIAIHVAAALRHALVLRDGILARMLPQFGHRPHAAAAWLVLASGLVYMGGTDQALATEWSVNPQ
ncbi:MAG: cytochrome b, partial [Rhodomicrobium sp.]|nr:cytochrome b [Rhodomicrobium sp.]